MITFVEAEDFGLQGIIKLCPVITIRLVYRDWSKYDDLHEYAIDLSYKVIVEISESIVGEIENDLKEWECNLK